MMKRTKKKIAFSAIAVVLIAAAVLLYFVLRDNGPVNVGDVTPTVVPTESVNNDKEVTKEPTATAEPVATDAPTPTEEAGTPVPTVTPEGKNPGEDVTPVPLPTPSGVPDGMEVIPAPTFAPTPTPEVYATATPIPTKKPTATPKPTVTPKPTKVKAEYFYEELAKICGLNPDDPVEVLKENGIIPAGIDTDKVVREDAFVVMKNACDFLGLSSDSSMVKTVTDFERLSDIGKLTATEKAAAYYMFANGIVEGVSDGEFTRTRSIKPKDSLSKEDTDLYLKRMIGMADRFVLSPDGQVTRKSDIRNMDLYPYLLESIPDSFYTRVFRAMGIRDGETWERLYESGFVEDDGTVWIDGGGIYAGPAMYRKMYGPNGTAIGKHHVLDSVVSEERLEKAVEEYLMKTFNVDYHTTPKDAAWKNYMLEMSRGMTMGYENEIDPFSREYIDSYLDVMKKNHTVIECDMVRAEASTLHEFYGDSFIRCYVHYRVKSFDSAEPVWIESPEMNGPVNPLLCNLAPEYYPMVQLLDLKEGEWRDGYFDIRINEDAVQGIEPARVWEVEFMDVYNNHSIEDY